jgi:hypothetical protein
VEEDFLVADLVFPEAEDLAVLRKNRRRRKHSVSKIVMRMIVY